MHRGSFPDYLTTRILQLVTTEKELHFTLVSTVASGNYFPYTDRKLNYVSISYPVYSVNYLVCLLISYLVYSVNYIVCLLIKARINQVGEYNS